MPSGPVSERTLGITSRVPGCSSSVGENACGEVITPGSTPKRNAMDGERIPGLRVIDDGWNRGAVYPGWVLPWGEEQVVILWPGAEWMLRWAAAGCSWGAGGLGLRWGLGWVKGGCCPQRVSLNGGGEIRSAVIAARTGQLAEKNHQQGNRQCQQISAGSGFPVIAHPRLPQLDFLSTGNRHTEPLCHWRSIHPG